ncbi:MAG: Hpt domain-containing protein [Bacillota bacterium]|nr:Hpt domain-containing protein [Bacillota bacterium]
MEYSVKEVARELMLEPEDLVPVFVSFFEEASQAFAECYQALKTADLDALRGRFHALKGASANLRMHAVTELVMTLEDGARSADLELIARLLPGLQKAVDDIKERVRSFYGLNESALG